MLSLSNVLEIRASHNVLKGIPCQIKILNSEEVEIFFLIMFLRPERDYPPPVQLGDELTGDSQNTECGRNIGIAVK